MSSVDRVQGADPAARLVSMLVATERERSRCGACSATRRGEATRVGSPGRVPRRSNRSAPSARPSGQIIHPRVSNASLTQSTPACSCPRTVLGDAPPGCPGPDRPESSSVFVGRHLVVRNALLREPAAVNTRGVVGGRVGAGAGRSSVDSVDGSPLPSGADTALAGHARLTCVETWRSSGEAVGETSRTIARHSPGAAAPTARSRAGRGCQQVSMWRMGARSRARQTAAAVVAAAACEQGQESAPRALTAGRLPGNGSIVTHQRYAATSKVASLPVLVGICIIGGGTTRHD